MALRNKRQGWSVMEGGRGRERSERTSQPLGLSALYQGLEQTSARAGWHRIWEKVRDTLLSPQTLKARDTLNQT